LILFGVANRTFIYAVLELQIEPLCCFGVANRTFMLLYAVLDLQIEPFSWFGVTIEL
jgi:hypothetical protein